MNLSLNSNFQFFLSLVRVVANEKSLYWLDTEIEPRDLSVDDDRTDFSRASLSPRIDAETLVRASSYRDTVCCDGEEDYFEKRIITQGRNITILRLCLRVTRLNLWREDFI